jgi:hypothetical protein
LGFDGGCSACGELDRRIGETTSKLEVRSLHDSRVEEWRRKALGEHAPLVPTLFEVGESEEVRAWTGWRLGAALGRFLGPFDTWRVMQALGEAGEGPEDEEAPVEGEAVIGLTRGQFLRGVGGAAVAMSVLSTTGRLAAPARAQSVALDARTNDDAAGVSAAHPAEWLVEREPYTLDDTYGFTLWEPASVSSQRASSSEGSPHEHGGTPVVRVALAYGLRPKQIEATVKARIAEYSHLSMKREVVTVGEKKYKGVAVGPIPGSTPSTEVYVAVGGRVYQINVYGEKLDAAGRRLLRDLRFGSPSRTVGSLGLPDANAPEMLYTEDDPQLVEPEVAARIEAQSARTAGEAEFSAQAYTAEYKISGGCWRAASGFFFQTQHGMYANKRWGAAYTGWAQVGIPNYWGQYTHGNLGYGRCVAKIYTNDMYAVDYPLGKGDVVFSPFKRGTVTFAGRNYTHKDYGIFVSIKADNGKYVNLSAHLSGLASGIRKGVWVTDATVIGYAGNTGGPNTPLVKRTCTRPITVTPATTPTGHPTVALGCRSSTTTTPAPRPAPAPASTSSAGRPTRRPGRRETGSATNDARVRARYDRPTLTRPSF